MSGGVFLRSIAPLMLVCCALARAQESRPSEGKPDPKTPTFQAKVNLVLVPVVVRDKRGRPVANLKKEDFQLFDNGKPQVIASFSTVDRRREAFPNSAPAAGASTTAPQGEASTADTDRPERYFIYLFDDVNIRFADMANVRAAAVDHFKNNFAAGDHAAIDTISGKHSLEFSGDREKLQTAVSRLRWGQLAGRGGMECPDVSYYIADLIVTKADRQALAALTNHTAQCAYVRPEVAQQLALAAANRQLILGPQDTRLALSTLKRAIRRLSGMPGQRVIVLASPGFFAQTPEAIKATAEVLELAAKHDVIINGLSVRGVIMAEEEQDVTRRVAVSRRAPPGSSSPSQLWLHYRRESARADGDSMNELAEGTGGIFFHNNNSLRAGFAKVAAAPEFSYVLGFSPPDSKPDGAFHTVKVHLQTDKGASLEARRGYYALKPAAEGSQSSTEALEDAVFSRDQRNDVPVVVQTGYSRAANATVAKVLVVAKIDVSSMPHPEATDQNRGAFDVAVTLFDQEGAYTAGTAEKVKLDVPGQTASPDSVTLRWEFPDIQPGDYLVRLVVREPKGQAMTAINRSLLVRSN